ncbi:MAG: STAS domain-containing protein [Actinomycetota bacterium]
MLEVVSQSAEVDARTTRAFRLVGELDAGSVEAAGFLVVQTPAGPEDLRLDLSELTFMGSEGVRLLIDLARARAGSGELVLVNPTRVVRRILELTGVERLANLRVLLDAPATG